MNEDPCGCTVCSEGAYSPPATPSLAAGAIARSLTDAAESYRRRTLAGLVDGGPWDD